MSSFEDKKKQGVVFNIQKYSVHDGPGIRTLVFLKGCPLRCAWCSNPESQEAQPELAVNQGRCIDISKCGYCIAACPHQAISSNNDKPVINRTLCGACPQLCAQACPAQGIITYGAVKTVQEVIAAVEQDSLFYSRSEGGITLSGGEPLFQAEFSLALLRQAKVHHIAAAMETCGLAPYEVLHEACGLLNDVLFDIKSMDEAKHKQFTKVSLATILKNFKQMALNFPQLNIHVRTPVIPGFNDSVADITAIAQFAAQYPNVDFEPLPYHRLGTQKYIFLGKENPMGAVSLDDRLFKQIDAAVRALKK